MKEPAQRPPSRHWVCLQLCSMRRHPAPPTLALSFVAGIVLSHSKTAEATVVADLPIETMAERAAAVVRAHVERVGTRIVIEGPGHRVETIVRLKIHDWWKGDMGTSTLVLVEPGGITPYGRVMTHGAPSYEAGQEVIVFAERDPGQRLHTLGLALGRFYLEPGPEGRPWARRDLSDVGLAQDRNGRLNVATGTNLEALPLAELRARVMETVSPSEGTPR